MKSICVFCGSNSGKGTDHLIAAQQLGEIFAKENITLVYGGGNVGIMGEIANTVLQYNGKVIGVIPEDLVQREAALYEVTELKIVKSMHERKALMSELSDGFIALSGGMGTLEEFLETWTWAQLGIHSKPIGLLNVNGYYDLLLKFINNCIDNNFIHPQNLDMIVVDNNPNGLIDKMKEFKPVKVRKWMSSVNS